MNNEDRLRRALRAKEIIGDPILVGALDSIERATIEEWANTTEQDAARREQLYWKIKAVQQVRAALDGIVNDGAIARDAIDRANRKDQVA